MLNVYNAKLGVDYLGVKLEELMKLPSLQGATVVAGKRALEREIMSLSFLEACDMSQLRRNVLKPDEYFLGELDITSLYTIKDDPEKQCELIKGMHDLGVVGIIVYYVGVFVPRLDDSFLQTANEINFAIIQMPVNDTNIRFNEAVTEISQMLFEYRNSEFEPLIMRKLSEVPKWSQTIETALKMLADALNSNVVITNGRNEIEYGARWPRNSELNLAESINGTEKIYEGSIFSVELGEKNNNEWAKDRYDLWLVKERGQLTDKQLQQAKDVVENVLDIWGTSSLHVTYYSLIWGILNNESDRSQRVASKFGIDIKKINVMWIVSINSIGDFKEVIDNLDEYLKECYEEVVIDHIDDHIVVMCGGYKRDKAENNVCNEWLDGDFAKKQIETVVYCPKMNELADFGRSYRLVIMHRLALRKVFPNLRFFSLVKCEYVVKTARGLEDNSNTSSDLLGFLNPVKKNEELMHTLCTYLLDAQRDLQKTSELLFVHRNTVKYRLKRISEILGCNLLSYDECFAYYLACIAYRLIN